ncbi:MAG: DNA-binding domain-containing protein [Firmicutes bacterium]|nr:DNA-binding domain-containing protein [Bacillota bacterium]
MKYYIIDDNIATVKTLENIVRIKGLGTVAGYATDPQAAMEEILENPPDIVLVDLLMEGIDGITLVQKIRARNDRIAFVMISKVSDKEMIQRAYTAGVEFFINKPVNIVEVERVLANVSEKVRMRELMGSIREIFDGPKAGAASSAKAAEGNDVDILFGTLGMLGEKGIQDIRSIFREMLDSGGGYDREILSRVADKNGDTVKNIEQRVRRAIRKGLSNAAAIGLDDFESEAFTVYAGYVFDFKTLKDEMNYAEGKAPSGGRINIAGFFEGLLLYYNSK